MQSILRIIEHMLYSVLFCSDLSLDVVLADRRGLLQPLLIHSSIHPFTHSCIPGAIQHRQPYKEREEGSKGGIRPRVIRLNYISQSHRLIIRC